MCALVWISFLIIAFEFLYPPREFDNLMLLDPTAMVIADNDWHSFDEEPLSLHSRHDVTEDQPVDDS